MRPLLAPGALAALLLLLSGLPALGVTLADADFLAETLAPSTLTRSLLTDDVRDAKPGWTAPAPRPRGGAGHPGATHAPPPAARAAQEALLPPPPWRAALRHCLDAQQSGCV